MISQLRYIYDVSLTSGILFKYHNLHNKYTHTHTHARAHTYTHTHPLTHAHIYTVLVSVGEA